MSNPRLVLLPKDPSRIPDDIPELQQALTNAGLIDQSLDNADTCLPGDNFLSLLTFLGCSPNINLRPADGKNFCFVAFRPVTQHAVCQGYTSSIFPRCPQCKANIKNWMQINNWQFADTKYHCKECATETTMLQLKWRQKSIYGRFSIIIANIHPHEAVPSEKLLTTLATATGFSWTYFYANNEDLP
ncbi:MAG: hypothetical protein OQL06_10735 [Gammaproteobacteria bacterium]|nr:hypothetical protein [Gammaproteobacteria bacterium]